MDLLIDLIELIMAGRLSQDLTGPHYSHTGRRPRFHLCNQILKTCQGGFSVFVSNIQFQLPFQIALSLQLMYRCYSRIQSRLGSIQISYCSGNIEKIEAHIEINVYCWRANNAQCWPFPQNGGRPYQMIAIYARLHVNMYECDFSQWVVCMIGDLMPPTNLTFAWQKDLPKL